MRSRPNPGMVWALFLLGVLTLAAGGAGRPSGPGYEIGCGCVGWYAVRAQDPRVTEALIESAGRMGTDARVELLVSLATNPTITPENELRLIDAAERLGSDNRRRVLVAIAGAVRMEPVGLAP